MNDDSGAPAEGVAEPGTGEPTEEQKPEIDWKAKSRDWERKAKANAEAARKLAQIEEASKTEADKAAEKLQALETQVADLGVNTASRIVAMEYDHVRPWSSRITLSSKLRELGSTETTDGGVLTTGASIDTRDLRPFNELLNACFDNRLAHWAASGATIVPQGVTGPNACRLADGGWIEQTFAPDHFDVWTISAQIATSGFPEGTVPDLVIEAEFSFDDATTQTVVQQLVGGIQ